VQKIPKEKGIKVRRNGPGAPSSFEIDPAKFVKTSVSISLDDVTRLSKHSTGAKSSPQEATTNDSNLSAKYRLLDRIKLTDAGIVPPLYQELKTKLNRIGEPLQLTLVRDVLEKRIYVDAEPWILGERGPYRLYLLKDQREPGLDASEIAGLANPLIKFEVEKLTD